MELSAADVARVRVGPLLGPLAESLLALANLTPRTAPPVRRGLVGALRQQALDRDRALASFLWLSPSVGLDLFTPAGPTSTIDEGRDAVLGASPVVLSAELTFWASARAKAGRLGVLPVTDRRLLPDLAGLRDGNVDSVRALLVAVEKFNRRRITPSWPAIRDQLLAEQSRLGQRLARGGVESLLSGLGPRVRWSGTVLELPTGGVTGATHTIASSLGGRGLVVSPSYFAPEPAFYAPADVRLPTLLIVPVRPLGAEPLRTSSRASRPGADLMGPTRSAVLAALADRPRTTSELSTEVGVALSGASQHASVLRRAGLVSTTRDGGRVLHAITELGAALLQQMSDGADPGVGDARQ